MLQKNWSELIKPTKMEVNVDESNGRVGKLIAEPLERGFGLTLGNSIRRILLSSLQGAAITSVKIKGVVHEFSTIPGVKEDLTDICLFLKTNNDTKFRQLIDITVVDYPERTQRFDIIYLFLSFHIVLLHNS